MTNNPKEIAIKYWGFEHFRGSQEQIIDNVLNGKNVLALLPTGGGKSVCYQIPALAKKGICIVISPLVALIQDQVNSLKNKGIKAIALTGSIKANELVEKLDNCVYGNYKFLYLSPERLQQDMVIDRIQEMNVNLIAVDEAHCISQWGHDFRPAYLKCTNLTNVKPEVPVIALTATATKRVVADILENLQLPEATIFKDSFERKNISYEVFHTENKLFSLKTLLSDLNSSAIVYVRNRRATIELTSVLNQQGHSADYYHGGLSKDEKNEKLAQWTNNRTIIIVATNAFGMGIDKADVRTVVHYQLPENLENYFQESGRAGRDGLRAKAVLLTNEEDKIAAHKQFIQSLPSPELVKTVYKKLNAHLQIAYGEGFNETYGLNYAQFCEKYKFKKSDVFEVLRVLDQNSILSFSQFFKQRSSLYITAEKGELFDYFERNTTARAVIQTILRTYGGLFDFETRIDLELIAKKTGSTTIKVKAHLEKLQSNGLAEFNVGDEDLEITFLVQREDDNTINTIVPKLKHRNQIKQQNFKSVLSYIENTTKCRSQFLLQYFEEDHVNECGICDTCVGKENKPRNLTIIKEKILEQLDSKRLNSKELSLVITSSRRLLLTAIQELLEDGHIELDARNRYGKK